MTSKFDDAVLTAALRSVSKGRPETSESHPSPDLLLAYHDRRLTAEETARLREHFVRCRECSQRALDLEAFSERSLDDGVEDAEAGAAWATTRRRLESEGILGPAPIEPRSKRPGQGFRSGARLAWATAAVFLLTSIGLTLRLVDVSRALDEQSQPRANSQLVDLQPVGTGGKRDDSWLPASTTAGPEDKVMLAYVDDPGAYPDYRIEFLTSENKLVWSSDELRDRGEEAFTFSFPGRLLPAGTYLIRLYGLVEGDKESLAEYRLEVVDP